MRPLSSPVLLSFPSSSSVQKRQLGARKVLYDPRVSGVLLDPRVSQLLKINADSKRKAMHHTKSQGAQTECKQALAG